MFLADKASDGLCGLLLMLQAALADGQFLDLFPFHDDGALTPGKFQLPVIQRWGALQMQANSTLTRGRFREAGQNATLFRELI